MAVTSADVARKAGLSIAVVSYVFNDGPRPVSAETRQKVLLAARELGYRPNRLARGLRGGRSGFTGILAPDSSIPFYAELNRALVTEIGRGDSIALLAYGSGLAGGEAEALDSFTSAQIDGLIVVWFGDEPMKRELPVRTVFVHHRPPGADGPFIAADNDHSVRLAVEHLRSHGYDRPVLWAGLNDAGPVGERVQAWRLELDEPGAEPIRSSFTSEAARDLAIRRAESGDLPEAIICATDQQAFGLLAGAWAVGLRVPTDVAIVSLDGSASTEFTVPPLTVVKQPVAAMAAAAVSILQGTPSAPESRGELIVRSSCGC